MSSVMFHGGCLNCTRQETEPIENCAGCMFFDADWSLPSLNNRPPESVDEIRWEIKRKLERLAKAAKE